MLKHCTHLVVLAFCASLGMGVADATPPSLHGMEFINNTSAPLYFSGSYTIPNSSQDTASPCPTPPAKPPPGVTLSMSAKHSGALNDWACTNYANVTPNNFVTQQILLPTTTGNATEIQVCSALNEKYGQPNGCDAQQALCMTNQYTPSDSSSTPVGSLLPGSPIAKLNDSALVINNQSIVNDSFWIKIVNPVQGIPGDACVFNIDLSQYLQDIEPVAPPARQILLGNTYPFNTTPILDMSNYLINSFKVSNPTESNMQYYVTLNSLNGNSSTQQVVTAMGADPTAFPSNPINLQFNFPKVGYHSVLFTNGPAIDDSTCDTAPYGTCRVFMCACDTGITAQNVFGPDGGGICPAGGLTSCNRPTGAGINCTGNLSDSTWVEPNHGPVGTCFFLTLAQGIYAKNPTEIANTPGAYLTTGLPQSGGWINLSNFFANTNPAVSTADATYSIVNSSTGIPDRVNGDAPSVNDILTPYNAGWEPMIIHNGAPGTPIADANINSVFLLAQNTQAIPTTSSSSAGNDWLYVNGSQLPNNAVVQLTVEATQALPAPQNATPTAYQTFYVNLSSQNTTQAPNTSSEAPTYDPVYSLQQPGLSAWVYGPNMAPGMVSTNAQGTPTCHTPLTATPVASCTTSSWDYPNCLFVPTINNHNISTITPDIGWVQYGTNENYLKYWNNDVGPLNNNIYTDANLDVSGSMIDCLAQYYNLNTPNTQFITTYEFDAPLKGSLPTLSSQTNPLQLLSQLGQLTANIGIGIYNDPHIAGIQFDVEPLPTDPHSILFFKNVADLLARAGKTNEIFAFADADSPALIMAQGPLGIFLPSTYDVGQTVDPTSNYQQAYYSTFGTPPNTLPADPTGCTNYPYALSSSCLLGQLDYACHFNDDPTPGTNLGLFLIKSYCNININNTLFSNATRFGIHDANNPSNNNPDFAYDQRVYGGHFQLAVPSEGSAENWTYEIIYNPQLTNASGGACDTSKSPQSNPCMIPSLPSNFTPVYVPISPTNAASGTNADFQAAATSANLSYPPAAQQYYLYYPSGSSSVSGQPLCLLSPANSSTPHQQDVPMCVAAVVSNNPNNENDPSANIPLSQYPGQWQYQAAYISAITSFATNQMSNRYTPLNGIYLGAPVSNTSIGSTYQNPNNLGLGLYALAVPEVYGCQPGQSHGGNPNCIVNYPLSTSEQVPNASGVLTPNPVWPLVASYMGSTVPPVYPVTIKQILIAAPIAGSASPRFQYAGQYQSVSYYQIAVPGATPTSLQYQPGDAAPQFTGLTAGQQYRVSVTAYNASGNPLSETLSVPFTEYGSYPVTVTPVNPTVTGQSAQLTVQYSPSSTSLPTGAAFSLYVSGPNQYRYSTLVSPDSPSATLANLATGTYQVTALAQANTLVQNQQIIGAEQLSAVTSSGFTVGSSATANAITHPSRPAEDPAMVIGPVQA